MKIRCFLQGMIFVIPLLFSSCNDVKHLSNENKSRVICSIGKFESDNPSRTNIDPNNNFSIKWASEDIIGIFPREGYQEPFEIINKIFKEESITTILINNGYYNQQDLAEMNDIDVSFLPFTDEQKTKVLDIIHNIQRIKGKGSVAPLQSLQSSAITTPSHSIPSTPRHGVGTPKLMLSTSKEHSQNHSREISPLPISNKPCCDLFHK